MKILIADDQQIIRFGLKLVLNSIWDNLEIIEVENLDGVVSAIAIDNFDLVILDIHMPGSDGLENLIRFMLAETSVVIFSGLEPTNNRIQSLADAGVDLFIFKDGSIEEIKFELRSHFY